MNEPIDVDVMHSCSCGAVYSYEAWQALRFVGPCELGTGCTLELRDCSRCRSTLARPMLPAPVDVMTDLERGGA